MEDQFKSDFDEKRAAICKKFSKEGSDNTGYNTEESEEEQDDSSNPGLYLAEDDSINTISNEINNVNEELANELEKLKLKKKKAEEKRLKNLFKNSAEQLERNEVALNNHDLGFIHQEIIPVVPIMFIKKIQHIVWDTMGELSDTSLQICLPTSVLDHDQYGNNTTVTPLIRMEPKGARSKEDEKVYNSVKLNGSVSNNIHSFVKAAENVLLLQAFLNNGSLLDEALDNRDEFFENIRESIGKMILGIHKNMSRGAGTNGWQIQKIVDLFHMIEYMKMYGPASGFNAGNGERGLKKWAKAPAKTSQKQGQEIFQQQTAQQVFDQKNNIPCPRLTCG